MQFEIELGPQTLKALADLTGMLRLLAGTNGARQSQGGEWLNMTDACRAWGISPPTVKKRVQEGQVEMKLFGPKSPRYKLREV